MIDVDDVGLERHERQADMSMRGLRQQICAPRRRIHDRTLIVAYKVSDIAARAAALRNRARMGCSAPADGLSCS
jgi:hypothetical protein